MSIDKIDTEEAWKIIEEKIKQKLKEDEPYSGFDRKYQDMVDFEIRAKYIASKKTKNRCIVCKKIFQTEEDDWSFCSSECVKIYENTDHSSRKKR